MPDYLSKIVIKTIGSDKLLYGALKTVDAKGFYFESDAEISSERKIVIGLLKSPYKTTGNTFQCVRAQIGYSAILKESIHRYGYGVFEFQEIDPPHLNFSILRLRCSLGLNIQKFRQRKRITINKKVLFLYDNQFFEGTAKNISTKGIFIQTEIKPVSIQITNIIIPETKYDENNMIICKIVRVDEKGIGAKFIGTAKAR